jgi:pimeloyl-ACP methyl ester carboxylesterase
MRASFATSDGYNIAYAVEGEGEAVLFIQGVGLHGDGWLPQLQELTHYFRCIWYDNRGVGRSYPSQQGSQSLTMETLAGDARQLLDRENISEAHVVGHSMGGLIALEFALSNRARVRSLSLLCTFARGRDATTLTGRMLSIGIRTRLGTKRSRRRAFLEILLPPKALREIDQEEFAAEMIPIFGHDLAVQPAIAMKQLSAMSRYDATPRLKELEGIPTLVVSARYDPIARPQLGEALAKGIPGARYIEYDDAAHGLPIQFATRVNDLLREHFVEAQGLRNQT